MSETILLVFEGKTEKDIVKNIEKNFFKQDKQVIKAIYGTNIYDLFEKLSKKEDTESFDIVELLKERKVPAVMDIDNEDVSETYLFFDYDGHETRASDETIKKMLEHFRESTEEGKLFISYPMVESLKDFNSKQNFKEKCWCACEDHDCCNGGEGYKQHIGSTSERKYVRSYTRFDWRDLVTQHYSKANYIVSDYFQLPEDLIEQEQILKKQLEKYIPGNKIAVLSGFPLFISDYFGLTVIKEKLGIE